jgi:hypothetical protein
VWSSWSCDKQGAWYAASDIPTGQRAALVPLAAEEQLARAADRFLKTLAEYAPSMPPELSIPMSPRVSIFSPRYFGTGVAFAQTSMLDRGMSQAQTQILARDLPPGGYVAIVERPAEIVTGMDGLLESQSTHVIHGRW